MEVCFRSFSFLYGVICRFQPLIFQGVPSPTKQIIQVSRSSCAASKMCAVTCRVRFIMAVASGFQVLAFSGSKNAVLGRAGPASPRSSRVQHLQPMLRPPGRVGICTQLPRDVFAPCPLVVCAKSPAVVGDLVCNVTTVQFRFWPTLLHTIMCMQYIKLFRANLY